MKKIMRSIFCLGRDEGSTLSAVEKCSSFVPENVEAWACTEIEQETFSFLWDIKNFSSFTSTTKDPTSGTMMAKSNLVEMKSPIFKGGSEQNLWQLEINNSKKENSCFDYVSLYLHFISFGDGDNSIGRKVKTKFQLTLLDGHGRPKKRAGNVEFYEFSKDKFRGNEEIMRTNDLIRKNLLDNDCLKIHCRIWSEGNWKHETGSASDLGKASEVELKGKRLGGLSDDLGKLLTSSEMADVISNYKSSFIDNDNPNFKVHRMILAGRSPVFKRMLEIDMIESKTRSIIITDFDKEVVQGMLEYMYTGHTEILDKKAPELLQIAEKYDLGGLKENCEIQIANNLTVKNAIQVLVLAHLHNATVLKPAVISFINRNKDAVKKNKTFQKIAKANGHAFVDLYLSQL